MVKQYNFTHHVNIGGSLIRMLAWIIWTITVSITMLLIRKWWVAKSISNHQRNHQSEGEKKRDRLSQVQRMLLQTKTIRKDHLCWLTVVTGLLIIIVQCNLSQQWNATFRDVQPIYTMHAKHHGRLNTMPRQMDAGSYVKNTITFIPQ